MPPGRGVSWSCLGRNRGAIDTIKDVSRIHLLYTAPSAIRCVLPMRLTAFTDYSLRVLIYLALSGEQHTTIAQIAQSYGISKNHLMKVVQELSQKGYLIALRGKNGGLRLSRPPSDINIGELVRAMERDLAMAECFGKNNQCVLTPACYLPVLFTEALEAFFAVLDAYTLEDILPGRQRRELVKILNIV